MTAKNAPQMTDDLKLLLAAKEHTRLSWRGLAYVLDRNYSSVMGWKLYPDQKHPDGSARILLQLLAGTSEEKWFQVLRERIDFARSNFQTSLGRPRRVRGPT
jgi:hypothetical protein